MSVAEPIATFASASASATVETQQSKIPQAQGSTLDNALEMRPSIGSPVPISTVNAVEPDKEPEMTHTGRSLKRRWQDLSSLSQYLCGESAVPGDTGSIQCQKAGCETLWVSNRYIIPLKHWLIMLTSITLRALGMRRMPIQKVGHVRFVRRQKGPGGGRT